MRQHFGFDSLPTIERPVVTIGSFDGVHIGHAALLGRVLEEAQRVGGHSVVVTFSPHPRQVLPRGGDFKLITSDERKAELIADLGIDEMVIVEFSLEFAALSSEEFVRDFLVAKLGIHTLVVGYNHRFGHDRDVADNHFELLAERYGFRVVRAEALRKDGGKVSSSIIRNLLAAGNTTEAEQLLGHKL
jgi:riboflavin kinase/FMN adenylyltransferase